MSALLRRTRSVDFEGLYRHHAASVYRYAYAVLGSHADAEDVTQQTFLKRVPRDCAGNEAAQGRKLALEDRAQRSTPAFRDTQGKSREVELDEQLPQTAPERSDPSLADVLRALQHLPPVQRSVLVMREFEGRSYAEIAEIMNITQSALEGQIFPRAAHWPSTSRGRSRAPRRKTQSCAASTAVCPAVSGVASRHICTSARSVPLRGRAETTACTAEGDFGDADSRLDPSVPGRAGRHRQPGSERHGGGWGRRGRRRGSGRCRGQGSQLGSSRRRPPHGAAAAGGAGYGVATEPPACREPSRRSRAQREPRRRATGPYRSPRRASPSTSPLSLGYDLRIRRLGRRVSRRNRRLSRWLLPKQS